MHWYPTKIKRQQHIKKGSKSEFVILSKGKEISLSRFVYACALFERVRENEKKDYKTSNEQPHISTDYRLLLSNCTILSDSHFVLCICVYYTR